MSSEILIGHGDFGAKQGEPYKIELEAIPLHVLACGTTGSGKTVCLKVCAESILARGIPVVALDVMGDLAGLAVPAGSKEVYAQFGLPDPVGVTGASWELAAQVAARLSQKVHARYLTPCSDNGERLAISPLPQRPKHFHDEWERDRDEVELQASSAAWALMGKIGLKQPRDGVGGEPELVRGLIFEAIIECWKTEESLEGIDGIERFLEIANKLFDNRMPPSQHVRFESGLRSLMTGQAARWLEGVRLDWDHLFSVPTGKVPLIIIALEHLPKEQHPWVVSQVVNSLASWCKAQPPTPGRPRVALLIDELAGEGGKNSLLPHLTYSSASGTAIRHVLRKGRHWGLGVLAGTQSPSDIDGRSITFFNTIFAGRLKTQRDISLALSGGQMTEDRLKKVAGIIKAATAPRMFYARPNGWCDSIAVRWLGSLHSRIERQHVPKLYELGFLKRPTGHAARWTFIDQVMIDDQRRTVGFVLHQSQTIVVGVVDSAGVGAHAISYPWSVEGILRASVWITEHSGSLGVRFVTRSPRERDDIQSFARQCHVSFGGERLAWSQVSVPDGTAAAMVKAIHSAVRQNGALESLAASSEAA